MSMGEIQRYYAASQIIQAEEQLQNIQSASFSDFKKPTREKIISQLKGARRRYLKTSGKPVTVEQVLKGLRGAGYG